ncbi:MAG: hypothetical protein OXH38_11920 [Chloroflexi bacterium]|nr:hypothetical protein [Chloroflexota bacterium]
MTGTPRIALSIASAARYATFNSGESILSGFGTTSHELFDYTVRAGDYDGDGVSVEAGSFE